MVTLVDSIKKKMGTVKDNMISINSWGYVLETDTVLQAAKVLQRKHRQFIPVMKDNEIIGVITKDVIFDAFVKGITRTTKVKTIKLNTPDIISFEDNIPMKKVFYQQSDELFVVSNKSKKIIGILTPEIY